MKYILILSLFFPFLVKADIEHNLLRKIAVFPIAEANVANNEEAWWQMREFLTRDKKLLIASKRFMINRGVFQPRRMLKPADAIILGRLLDAQALMVTFLEDRTLRMVVYDGENGYILWQEENQLHPAIAINDQLIKACTKMVSDFMQALPYQGFILKDEITDKIISEKEDKRFVKIFYGAGVTPDKGDPVELLRINGDASKIFLEAMNLQILGEAEIVEVQEDYAIAELLKVKDLEDVKENTLVRFPKEASTLKNLYHSDVKSASLSGEYLNNELKPISDFQKEHSTGATAVAILVNIAAFMLIAF